jgi:hypothetical protein
MSASKFSTYDQVGQVEDVSDVIANITPSDTPFQTMVKTGSCKAKTIEWQEDTLASAGANAVVEGADAPTASQTATTMRTNYTQILTKSVKVTGSSRAIDLYGRDDEMAYQLAKKSKEIKMDLEYHLVGITQTKVLGDDSTARKFDNAYAQIASGVTSSNGGTERALTETLVNDVLKLLWDEGGDATVLMVRPADLLTVSNFAYRTTSNAQDRGRPMGQAKTLVNVVEVLVTPYGEVKVVANRHLKKFVTSTTVGEALVFNPSNFKLRWLRKWNTEVLAKTGDYESKMLLGEVTLEHRNQKVSGRITDLSTA